MSLKNDEIEKLKRENGDIEAAFAQAKASMSMCSPHETRPTGRDDGLSQIANNAGMEMNIDLQAKMIEELIMKNSQLSEENTQHLQVKGPFSGAN